MNGVIGQAIRSFDPAVALVDAAPFTSFLAQPLSQPRFNALLLAIFASAAVTLSAIGLFAVMATLVRQRTREIGIRMALGATGGELRSMILRRGVGIAGTGLAVGLAAALGSNRLLGSLLYQVSPTDLVTIGVVMASLLGVAILATIGPAWQSTKVDPVRTLHAED